MSDKSEGVNTKLGLAAACAVGGAALTAALMLLWAVPVLKGAAGEGTGFAAALGALFLGTFAAGCVASARTKMRKLPTAMLTAGGMAILLLAATAAAGGAIFSLSTLTNIIVIFLASTCGCLVGSRRKHKRRIKR